MDPSPPYLGLILASCNKLKGFISHGYQLSPKASFDFNSDEELDDEVTQAFGRVQIDVEESRFPASDTVFK